MCNYKEIAKHYSSFSAEALGSRLSNTPGQGRTWDQFSYLLDVFSANTFCLCYTAAFTETQTFYSQTWFIVSRHFACLQAHIYSLHTQHWPREFGLNESVYFPSGCVCHLSSIREEFRWSLSLGLFVSIRGRWGAAGVPVSLQGKEVSRLELDRLELDRLELDRLELGRLELDRL